MLNPLRYGLLSWQLASHKLCRWLVPFAMIAALVSNAALVLQSPLYVTTFLMQSVFYAAALWGLGAGIPALKIPTFLFLANLGVLMAWVRFARGERIVCWSPSERVSTRCTKPAPAEPVDRTHTSFRRGLEP